MVHSNLFSEDEQATLLKLAYQSIHFALDYHSALRVDLSTVSEKLAQWGASFVTLSIDHQLRGCIGSLSPYQPLAQDVAQHAYDAAFNDHRFTALTRDEFAQTSIHLSVLNPPEPLHVDNEQALLNRLRPGIDGLILEDQGYRSTFLPSVWKELAEPKVFMQHLKRKAGLSADHWSDSIRFQRYTVSEWGD
jgi:AmmeMemoRadiSam system protein A